MLEATIGREGRREEHQESELMTLPNSQCKFSKLGWLRSNEQPFDLGEFPLPARDDNDRMPWPGLTIEDLPKMALTTSGPKFDADGHTASNAPDLF